MKQLFAVLVLASLVTPAFADVAALDLVSPMNFMLRAMNVGKTPDGKVAVRLERAVIEQPDKVGGFFVGSGNHWQDIYAKMDKLSQALALPDMNALEIQFEESDCRTNSGDSEVFFCEAKGPRKVAGLSISWDGAVEAVGTVTAETTGASVALSKTLTVDPSAWTPESFSAKVIVGIATPAETILFNHEKNELIKKQNF